MSWVEGVITVFVGNVITLAPMVLNAHPGTKYGIPFPVLARSSFGIKVSCWRACQHAQDCRLCRCLCPCEDAPSNVSNTAQQQLMRRCRALCSCVSMPCQHMPCCILLVHSRCLVLHQV